MTSANNCDKILPSCVQNCNTVHHVFLLNTYGNSMNAENSH